MEEKVIYSLASTSQPEFDDAAQTVVYKMNVVEGPQFRMGQFITRGFSETETQGAAISLGAEDRRCFR